MVSEWYSRVYLPRGKVAHLLSGHHSPSNGGAPAVCGRGPAVFHFWLGTGTHQEFEKAASLPLCKQCLEAS